MSKFASSLLRYFNNLGKFDKLVLAVVGLLLIKWLLGPVSTFSGSQIFKIKNTSFGTTNTFYTGGVAMWGVLLYAGAFLAIRLGFIQSFFSEKKGLLILFGLCCVWVLFMAFFFELRYGQLQFLLSLAVIGLQIYAYLQLPPPA